MCTVVEHALNNKTYLLSDREESSGETNPFHKGIWHLKVKTAKIPKAAHYACTQQHCTWVLNKHAFIRAALYFCTTICVHDLYITTINLYCLYMPLHTCTRSSRCMSANAHTRDYNVNFKYKENDNRLQLTFTWYFIWFKWNFEPLVNKFSCSLSHTKFWPPPPHERDDSLQICQTSGCARTKSTGPYLHALVDPVHTTLILKSSHVFYCFCCITYGMKSVGCVQNFLSSHKITIK